MAPNIYVTDNNHVPPFGIYYDETEEDTVPDPDRGHTGWGVATKGMDIRFFGASQLEELFDLPERAVATVATVAKLQANDNQKLPDKPRLLTAGINHDLRHKVVFNQLFPDHVLKFKITQTALTQTQDDFATGTVVVECIAGALIG